VWGMFLVVWWGGGGGGVAPLSGTAQQQQRGGGGNVYLSYHFDCHLVAGVEIPTSKDHAERSMSHGGFGLWGKGHRER